MEIAIKAVTATAPIACFVLLENPTHGNYLFTGTKQAVSHLGRILQDN